MSSEDPEPKPRRLTDLAEVLQRQVHPSQLDPVKVVSKAAFKPDPTGMLSTLRQRVSPAEAFRRHVEESHLDSVGTWGVSVAEAEAQSAPAWDDEFCDGLPADHASVDFTQHPTGNQKLRAASRLRDAAVGRGCLYTPGSDSTAAVAEVGN